MSIKLPSSLSHYFDHYSASKAPFIHQQLTEWANTQPLKGMRVLHHLPLVQNTLLKIGCLVVAGADVTVTNTASIVKAAPEAVRCLNESNIRYIANINLLAGEQFDIYFDCGAEAYQSLGKPQIGAVELTGSGDAYYRQQELDFPVISIDRSLTKQLETVFGTAESVSKAIHQLTKISLHEKSWLIFGFGKIGRGVAYFAANNSSPVVIVEPNLKEQLKAESLSLKVINPQDTISIQQALCHSDIIVTATGKKAILDSYSRDWFNNKILVNMGIYDEYGDAFQTHEILNGKKPVNFILKDPTSIEYMDPELYIHNLAALTLLKNPLKAGVYDLPKEIDKQIIHDWCNYHNISLEEIEKWFIQFGK